jgi:hypothetical protein
MKSLGHGLLLATLMTSSFAVHAQGFSINDGVKAGMKFIFAEDIQTKFGEEGSIILQQGSMIEKGYLRKKEPYCTVSFDAGSKKELDGALVFRNQEMIAVNIESSGSNLSVFGLGFSKSTFKITAFGVFEDAQKAGYKGKNAGFLELQPGSQILTLDCTGFGPDTSFKEVRDTVGKDVFTMKIDPEASAGLYKLMKGSVTYKKMEADKAAKEKKQQEDALKSLGQEVDGSASPNVLKAGSSLLIKGKIKTYTTASGFSGSIYQNGSSVGAVKGSDGIYSSKTNPLDTSKPYCKVLAERTMLKPGTLEVSFAPGIYEITSTIAFEHTKYALINFKYKGDLKGAEGVLSASLSCENILTIDDVKTSIGSEVTVHKNEATVAVGDDELTPVSENK